MLPLRLLITAITMKMTVTATTAITMTATTPPTMAAVLSGSAASVAILSDVVVVVAHCGSPNVLMAMEQLLSTSRRKPCTAMVDSVRDTKVPKYVISCELVTRAVP